LRKFAEEGDTVKLRSELVKIEDCIFEVRILVSKIDETNTTTNGETHAA